MIHVIVSHSPKDYSGEGHLFKLTDRKGSLLYEL